MLECEELRREVSPSSIRCNSWIVLMRRWNCFCRSSSWKKRKKISNNIYNWYFQTTYLYLTFSDNKQNFWLIKFFRIYQVLYHHASKLLTHHHAHGYHAINCYGNCEERDDVFYLFSHPWERQYPLLLNIRKTLRRSADGVNKNEYFFILPLFFPL